MTGRQLANVHSAIAKHLLSTYCELLVRLSAGGRPLKCSLSQRQTSLVYLLWAAGQVVCRWSAFKVFTQPTTNISCLPIVSSCWSGCVLAVSLYEHPVGQLQTSLVYYLLWAPARLCTGGSASMSIQLANSKHLLCTYLLWLAYQPPQPLSRASSWPTPNISCVPTYCELLLVRLCTGGQPLWASSSTPNISCVPTYCDCWSGCVLAVSLYEHPVVALSVLEPIELHSDPSTFSALSCCSPPPVSGTTSPSAAAGAATTAPLSALCGVGSMLHNVAMTHWAWLLHVQPLSQTHAVEDVAAWRDAGILHLVVADGAHIIVLSQLLCWRVRHALHLQVQAQKRLLLEVRYNAICFFTGSEIQFVFLLAFSGGDIQFFLLAFTGGEIQHNFFFIGFYWRWVTICFLLEVRYNTICFYLLLLEVRYNTGFYWLLLEVRYNTICFLLEVRYNAICFYLLLLEVRYNTGFYWRWGTTQFVFYWRWDTT